MEHRTDLQVYNEVQNYLENNSLISVPILQMQFKIGYNQAVRIMYMLQIFNYINDYDGDIREEYAVVK